MKNLLIRDVEDEIIADYKRAAADHGRSLSAELRDGLSRARPRKGLVGDELVSFVHALWAQTSESAAAVDSTPGIRADRDSR